MAPVHRMRSRCALTNAVSGRVVWSPLKSLWYSSMLGVALIWGPSTFSLSVAAISGVLTAITICVGHSVGFHRLLIHRSFDCPRWLEYSMVFVGTLVGMGGPRKMLYLHDIRDWSQRQSQCHPFYNHQNPIWKDWIWNLHCELKLEHPPEFTVDLYVASSRFYRVLDVCWLAVQIPVAAILYLFGGVPLVIWGCCVRIALSLTGHWLVGYLAHNVGPQDWRTEGLSTQGHNLPGLGLITMGEAWHNNHHAFPFSARLGIGQGQNDPGWWLIKTLKTLGLAWNIRTAPVTSEHQLNLGVTPTNQLTAMQSKHKIDDYRSLNSQTVPIAQR